MVGRCLVPIRRHKGGIFSMYALVGVGIVKIGNIISHEGLILYFVDRGQLLTTSQRSSTAYFAGTKNISRHERILQGLHRN
jgi:hypothetical protein